jgi:putative ABC transport system permease protein
MLLRHIVWKEMTHRIVGSIVITLGIALCITMVVSIQRVSLGGIDEMRNAMLEMGKNLVVLPKGVNAQHYWSGEFNADSAVLFEQDVRDVAHFCIHEHKPKILARHFIGSFQRPMRIDGQRVVLSGIMVEIDPNAPKSVTREAQKPLAKGEAELGWHAATRLGLKPGDRLRGTWTYEGEELDAPTFTVSNIRDETGTVQDFKVFVNSDSARRVFGVKEPVVNVIEAVSCMCSPQSLPQLAKRIEKKLHDLGRDVEATHFLGIVEARRQARRGTMRDANLLSASILAFSVLLMAGYSVLNARERRREIGILLAIATRPFHVAWAMLQKMLWIGLAGGALGCLLAHLLLDSYGYALVATLHPSMRSYVLAMTGWQMYIVAVALALLIAALPGLVGVWIASRTDPAETLREG